MASKVILEIRAGAGGDEASIFAGDLARMYQRYAAKCGWKFAIVDSSPGTIGGYKTYIAIAAAVVVNVAVLIWILQVWR